MTRCVSGGGVGGKAGGVRRSESEGRAPGSREPVSAAEGAQWDCSGSGCSSGVLS